MFDLASIAIDPVLASHGKWVDYKGGKFLVARWNSRKAESLRNELQMEFYSELSKSGDEKISDDLEDRYAKMQARILSETILLDWDNISNKGEPLKYSTETAYEFLVNPAFVDLYQFIVSQSIDRENYVVAETTEIVSDVKPSADS